MKKKTVLLAVIIMTLMLALNIPMTAFAATTAASGGIEAALSSDKDEYADADGLTFTLSARNTNAYDITGASVKFTLPDGLKLKSGELTADNITLKAGQEYKKEVTVEKNAPAASTTAPAQSGSPKTGDDSHIKVILAVMLALGAGSFLLRRNRRASGTILSLMVCAGFLASVSSLSSFAADKTVLSTDKTVKVAGTAYTVKAEFSFEAPQTATAAPAEANTAPTDNTAPAAVSYTVSFNVNGGSEVAPQTVNAGGCAAQPAAPTREGFTFAGWYADEAHTQAFSFGTPVSADTTVYAMWTNEFDKNGNDVPDCIENNDQTTDTDKDGISDYQEFMYTNTDPRTNDTNGNGTPDTEEDPDGDGVKNADELRNGTNPLKADTDDDGLSDSEETAAGTDPLKADTDGDGAADGWEKENGYDPLKADQSFNIKSTDGAMSLDLQCEGQYVADFSAKQVSDVFLNDSIPGYITPAYDFSLEGNPFLSAKLSFTFDEALAGDEEFEPVIYYFNEETQELEAQETTVSGNTATAELSHFSRYILLNRRAFEQVWRNEIKPPELNYNPDATLDIVFVIDYSQSMEENDPNKLFRDVCKAFIERLRQGRDKAAAVKFIRKAYVICGLTDNKGAVATAIDSIVYDNAHTTYSGTNGSAGLHEAISLFSASTADYKYIVFLTDGEDNRFSYSYDDLINAANASGITVYTVGLGSASESVLRKVAAGTGGRYYYATAAGGSADIPGLDDVFNDVQAETIDYTTDSNNDGITDYYTKLMCEGKLTTKSGARVFGDKTYEEIQAVMEDFDNDGIKNGDEIDIKTKNDKVTVTLLSSPVLADSEGDGIMDKADDAPFKLGYKDGTIGTLTIAAGGDGTGHGWLVFNSDVNMDINFKKIHGGRKYDPSSENLFVDADPCMYPIKRGGAVSISSFPYEQSGKMLIPKIGFLGQFDLFEDTIFDVGGIHYNVEFSNINVCHGRNEEAYKDAFAYSRRITETQLHILEMYWAANNYYVLYSHNCCTVSKQAWNLIFPLDRVLTDINLDPNTTIDYPQFLKTSIALKNGFDSDYEPDMIEMIENWVD